MQGLTAPPADHAGAADHESRLQEAAVFRRATAALRASQSGDPVARVKALTENSLLWNMVMMQLRDPRNALPDSLRGSIVSVGIAVRREAEQSEPDLGFLIAINEHIADGLCGH